MIITEYRVTRIAEPEDDLINQWKIQLTLEPCWFERTFMGKIFPETRILIGSCTDWHWVSGEPADYFWRWWAFGKTRDKKTVSGGTRYVNSRFSRSKDE